MHGVGVEFHSMLPTPFIYRLQISQSSNAPVVQYIPYTFVDKRKKIKLQLLKPGCYSLFENITIIRHTRRLANQVAHVLARVIGSENDLGEWNSITPPCIRNLVFGCLMLRFVLLKKKRVATNVAFSHIIHILYIY